jgi:hypothetical protein
MERDGGRPDGADDGWPTGSGKRWGRGGVSGFSGWVAAAVALAAATAGVAVGFFLVRGTSITIGGTGPSVTAAINGGTTITGSAHGIGGVKVGDEVAAQITGNASHLVTTTLQDPAQ